MEGKQAQWGASDWFASWLGQCYKGSPTEAELNFEEPVNKKETSTDFQGPSTPTGASNAASRVLGEALKKSDGSTKRYLIDNSVLQIKTHPGIAFRHCKEASKKVKEMRAAPWGETVDGTDEGDGWLKVGSYYLPMTHQGKPIITLVEDVKDPDAPAKAKQDQAASDNSVDAKSAVPLESLSGKAHSPKGSVAIGNSDEGVADGSAVQKDTATCPKKDVVAEPGKPMAPVAQESVSSPQTDVIVEPEKPPSHPAEDSASSSIKCVLLTESDAPEAPAEEGALGAGAEVDQLKKPVSFAGDTDVVALVKPAEQPQRAWFVQPSVGTWLHALPQVDVKDADCAIVEDRPIHIEAPPAKWQHQPSVGTWVHRYPTGIAASSKIATAKLEDVLQ